MKTFVVAKHRGKGENGMGGCHTRWADPEGLCSGWKTADWLNGLGDDDDIYVGKTTVGKVRQNWLSYVGSHIVKTEEAIDALKRGNE